MRLLGRGHSSWLKALVLGAALGGGHVEPSRAQTAEADIEAKTDAKAKTAAEGKTADEAKVDAGGQNRTLAVDREDAEMSAAMAAARASMDVFAKVLSANAQSLPLVKVAIPHKTGLEHMWMILTDISSEGVAGELRNDGVHVDFHAGDSYWAGHDQVSDWMVLYPPYDAGPIYGAFTTRVALKRDPSSVPKGVAERLQPLPER